VAITDESIGVSQLLGARARVAPPKSTPMKTENITCSKCKWIFYT